MAISLTNGFGCEPTWIPTALQQLEHNPFVFRSDNMTQAMLLFGIGNKKVEALGRWLRAMGLAQGSPQEMHLTDAGQLILEHDPHLELPGSWWFLHIMLALPSESRLSHEVWQWYANEPFLFGFDPNSIIDMAHRAFPNASKRTLQSGLNEVFKTLEATPLGSYGLLSDGSKEPPRNLPLSVFIAGVAEQMANLGRNTLNAEEISNLDGGAARALNITRSTMFDLLDEAMRAYGSDQISVSRTAGLDSVWLRSPAPLKWLKVYFAEQKGVSSRNAITSQSADPERQK